MTRRRRNSPDSLPIHKAISGEKSFSELIYHKFMTPAWLLGNATWNATKPNSADLILEIGSDSRKWEGIFWVRLIPSEIIDPDEGFTIKIDAILEHPHPVASSQPRHTDPVSIMISDGEQAFGVQVRDPSQYAIDNSGPYVGVEGQVNGTVLGSPQIIEPQGLDKSQKITNRRWPQVFHISLVQLETDANFNNLFGTCSSSIDGGHSTSFLYGDYLDTGKPLDLRLYRAEEEETYNIKSLEVTIFRDCSYRDNRKTNESRNFGL